MAVIFEGRRCPTWAADRIRKLEADLEYIQHSIRQLGTDKPSAIQVQVPGSPDQALNIPEHSTISFSMNDGHEWHQQVTVMRRYDASTSHQTVLEICMHGVCLVRPRASNLIWVTNGD